jgi:hypothetical protein
MIISRGKLTIISRGETTPKRETTEGVVVHPLRVSLPAFGAGRPTADRRGRQALKTNLWNKIP